jgi:hypothetical protein
MLQLLAASSFVRQMIASNRRLTDVVAALRFERRCRRGRIRAA